MKITYYALIASIFGILSGCNLNEATPVPVVQSTVPYVQIAQIATLTPVPTDSRQIRSIPTQTSLPEPATPRPTVSPYACGIEAIGNATQNEVVATLDYAAKTIEVAQTIHYLNISNIAFPELILAVEPNNIPNVFTLERLTIGDKSAEYGLNQNRLLVPLPEPMNPGCRVTLNLEFSLKIPEIGIGMSALKGYFGYSVRQINLGMWLPTVASHVEEGWLLHRAQAIGEQNALEQADWDVTLIFENAPENLRIAAPGVVNRVDDARWHIIHNDSRDFTVSLGDGFLITRDKTANGIQVELYHFADTVRLVKGASLDGALHAVAVAVQAAEQYSILFGVRPGDRIVIVQGDFPDGMEFSGLVFVSTNWFYSFEGGVQNYLTLITVHEVAHQWWYGRIGNDAAYSPWLDEALATYSEYIFIEEFYPQLREWWWSFRVAWYNPEGDVDSNVYEFESARSYINAVYLRGAQMLHNLREDMGTEAFFDFLAAYAQAGNGKLMMPQQFWSLLTPEQLGATDKTRSAFLRNPAIVSSAMGG